VLLIGDSDRSSGLLDAANSADPHGDPLDDAAYVAEGGDQCFQPGRLGVGGLETGARDRLCRGVRITFDIAQEILELAHRADVLSG
jgi:hypothetical protein